MSLLRIYAPLDASPERCAWSLFDGDADPVIGEGRLAELPYRAAEIQLVLRATDVILTTTQLPAGAKRLAGQVLAFALEEQTAGDPELNQVVRLGRAGENDVLAVMDKAGLARWRNALSAIGVSTYGISCETLMLPFQEHSWSIGWDGSEGFVRTAPLEGTATDRGNRATPPMSLRLLLDVARKNTLIPTEITVYPSTPDAAPEAAQWQKLLGVPVRIGKQWDWRSASVNAGINLFQERRRWHTSGNLLKQLRPAMWLTMAALALYATVLAGDWIRLAAEQRSLRQDMETRFRTLFPETVAVVDPALQTRRKLTDARHSAGLPDSSDFLPLVDRVATELKNIPANSVRILTYENGRLTIEIRSMDAVVTQRIINGLRQAGLTVDTPVNASKSGTTTTTISVRAS